MSVPKTLIGIAAAGIAVVVVAAVLFLGPFGQDGSAPSSAAREAMRYYRAEQVEVGIGIDPVTPRVGENLLVIELKDRRGNPLTRIPIRAYAEMPAMSQMPAMRAPADLQEVAPGRYEGAMNLSMRGAWPLTIEMQDPATGDEMRLRFDLATDRTGLELQSGATPVQSGDAASGRQGQPGSSTEADNGASIITIDNRRRQMIGVEIGEAAHRPLVRQIRAVGEVTYDERLLSQITLKFDGYIGDLQADYVGASVEKGQVLFTVYGPDLLAAQQEYLEIFRRRGSGAEDGLLSAARQRLRLWDMPEAEIEALERRGEPADYVPFHAPRAGTVIERNIADGSAASMGQTLLTIADLSRVWIEAQVFEADLDLIEEGMRATVSLPYLLGRRFEATVDYVYPYLDGDSRTGSVRLTLDNRAGELKPEMYAEVTLEVGLGERLSVPEEAVIVAGDSRVVFVDLGEGRVRPTRITTGRRAQGFIEVLDGLSAGDRVVTSGNFLLAAETRLKTGIEQW